MLGNARVKILCECGDEFLIPRPGVGESEAEAGYGVGCCCPTCYQVYFVSLVLAFKGAGSNSNLPFMHGDKLVEVPGDSRLRRVGSDR